MVLKQSISKSLTLLCILPKIGLTKTNLAIILLLLSHFSPSVVLLGVCKTAVTVDVRTVYKILWVFLLDKGLVFSFS